jgi:hypothetical protein
VNYRADVAVPGGDGLSGAPPGTHWFHLKVDDLEPFVRVTLSMPRFFAHRLEALTSAMAAAEKRRVTKGEVVHLAIERLIEESLDLPPQGGIFDLIDEKVAEAEGVTAGNWVERQAAGALRESRDEALRDTLLRELSDTP